MLINQQQVYLPTNNALSDVGHVAAFIHQLGQGIQHLASRVPDLVAFIQRANAYREATQKGLVFLTIPRSYYGRLTLSDLSAAMDGCEDSAAAVLSAVTADGASISNTLPTVVFMHEKATTYRTDKCRLRLLYQQGLLTTLVL